MTSEVRSDLIRTPYLIYFIFRYKKKVGNAIKRIQVSTATGNDIKEDIDIDSIARIVDIWSFVASVLFIIIFNIVFWTMGKKTDPTLKD